MTSSAVAASDTLKRFGFTVISMKTVFAPLLFAVALLAMSLPVVASAQESSMATIDSLDVPRYMGTWYEIAKYPNRFQSDCAGNTKATYSLNADGTIQVLNSCKLPSGEVKQAKGVARQLGDATSAKLEVRFAPQWLSWLPMVWGKYWVIDIDPQYNLVAVSEPTRTYLWVLARKPVVDPVRYNELLQRLKTMGFDTNKLERSPQGQ